jgi:NAD(P)-dependent dehydrogenase (short-subunit alcohol dehydrogenase family)
MTKRKVPAAVITSFLLLPLWWTEAVAQSREKVVQILNEQAAKSVTREISSRNVRASYYLCNIAESEAVAQTADRIRRNFGAVDVLANNAGTVVANRFSILPSKKCNEP